MKGTYCLIIEVEKDCTLQVGRLGQINFKHGFYIYVGSALNSLESRVKRHLSSKKKLHWHVDYLLLDSSSKIREVIFTINEEKIECTLASLISKNSYSMTRFGCSDCKCNSHLFYFKDYNNALKVVLDSFNNLKLKTHNLNEFNELIVKKERNN